MRLKSCLLFLFFVITALVASAAEKDRRDRILFDEDGDRIFENLQARMERARPEESIPVLVQYREGTPSTGTLAVRMGSLLSRNNLKYSYTNIPVVAASLNLREIRQLLADPQVEHIELDGVLHKAMNTASSSFGVNSARSQFHFTGDRDGKPDVYSSNDVVIAIIDTGAQGAHPDLRGKILLFSDYVNGRTKAYDDEGHGTHVAGVAAGSGKLNKTFQGVAPGAALVVLKVLDASGSGSISDGIAAIDEVIRRKAEFNIRILNLSLAVSGSSNGRDAFSMACNRAVEAGIITVVAAGNDGSGARSIGSPSAAAKVITVGAGADTGERGFYVADFSSRGPTADGRIKPDLWAPGVRLRSPQRAGGYSEISGTSFSAPFVAGVVALMLNAKPGLTPGTVKNILLGTAQHWAPGGKNNEFGIGRLQAYQAIARAAAVTQDLHPPDVPSVRFSRNTIIPGQDQAFTINVASARFPIAITIVISNYPSANIDLEVVSPDGTVVARSEDSGRQELVRFSPPVPGVYTLRLKAFLGATPYFLDVSGDLK